MAAAGGAARLEAAIGVSLVASPSSPAPVGAMIRWTAQVTGGSADFWYRFRVREPGGQSADSLTSAPSPTLDWTSLEEGVDGLNRTARDRVSLECNDYLELRARQSRQRRPGRQPDLSSPVFFFSSPGLRSRPGQRFESAEGLVQYTPYKLCAPGRSLNFYLAGLRPNRPSWRASTSSRGAFRSPGRP